jgi:hypothetical protein
MLNTINKKISDFEKLINENIKFNNENNDKNIQLVESKLNVNINKFKEE